MWSRIALRQVQRGARGGCLLTCSRHHLSLPSHAAAQIRFVAASRFANVGAVSGGRCVQRQAAWTRALAVDSKKQNYYEMLGVDRTASEQDLKRAYLREAKRWHPDVNPSPEATKRFAELAEAYETLRDKSDRAAYDHELDHGRGYASEGYSEQGAAGGAAHHHEHVSPSELFQAILEELGADSLGAYLETARQDAATAASAASQGDFGPARTFASTHRGLLATVILPIVVMLRFPFAAVLALRAAAILSGALLAIVRHPVLHQTIGKVAWARWKLLVQRATARARAKKREGR